MYGTPMMPMMPMMAVNVMMMTVMQPTMQRPPPQPQLQP
jgi:hypothetical protein